MNLKHLTSFLCLCGLFFGCDRKPSVSVRTTPREQKTVFQMPSTRPATQPTRKSPIAFTPPPSWQADPSPNDMRLAAFKIGASSTLVVTEMDRSTYANVLGNVNRWREQVKLPPVADVKDQPVEDVEIGGLKGQLFDMSNPPSARLFVAVLQRENSVLFFKLTGPADEAESALPDFKSFLKSITFN